MTDMSEQLKYIKTQSEKMKVDCEFVNYHFENTSTTISDSITNLAELVAKKVSSSISYNLYYFIKNLIFSSFTNWWTMTNPEQKWSVTPLVIDQANKGHRSSNFVMFHHTNRQGYSTQHGFERGQI